MNPSGLTNAPVMDVVFSAEEKQKFDSELAEILTHYPSDRKRAAMLPALRVLQSIKGWLPPEGLAYVAEQLGVSKERVLEVATFYVMFHTEKPGKYVIDVCTNLSCSLWGAERLLSQREKATKDLPCARRNVSHLVVPRPACRLMRNTTSP